MSPMVDFSQEELDRNKVITPDWYRVRINSVGEQPSKDGGSTNYPVEGVILKNATTGGEEFSGVTIGGIGTWFFNSKAKGFIVGFLSALGVTDIVAQKRYELSNAAGEEIEIYIDNDIYQGRTVNRVNHKYRPVGAGGTPAPTA